jgi:hypothetical protein
MLYPRGGMMRAAAAVAAGILIAASTAPAQDAEPEPGEGARITWGAVLDLRAARGSEEKAWLDGGLGKTRYGAPSGVGRTQFAVGQASLVADAALSEILAAHVQVNLDAEPNAAVSRARAGLVEAFALFRPEPSPRLRLRFKGGMFFPPISFEHPGPAWSTVHSITPSAINAWVGEELRSTGLEATAAYRGDRHELSATGALFSNNDPAGTLLSWRGWALHDRQTAAFDHLPIAPLPSFGPGGPFERHAKWVSPIREVDGHLGYSFGAAWSMDGVFDVRGSFWDNDADPTVFDGFQYGWYTEFWSAGARLRLPGRVELIGQYLDGTTVMGERPDATPAVDNGFRAGFVLATAAFGRHRLTARYDTFEVEDDDALVAEDPNAEDGTAWMVAYQATLGGSARLAVEWLRVDSTREARRGLGLAPHAVEDQVQASLRLMF